MGAAFSPAIWRLDGGDMGESLLLQQDRAGGVRELITAAERS